MSVSYGTRWGAFSLCLIMFLAHLLIGVDARMNGGFTASSSFYGAFWAYAAYLAFKTEVETLSKVLGWLIILNVCGFVYLAMLDSGGSPFSLTYFTKEDALVSVAITLAVKVGLWLYLMGEIDKDQRLGSFDANSLVNDPLKSTNRQQTWPPSKTYSHSTQSNPHSSDTARRPTRSDEKSDAYPPSVVQYTEQAVDEDAIYKSVSDELESDSINSGLWTRLYAESDGDEIKTKVAYIRHRAAALIEDARLQLKQEVEERNEAGEANPFEGMTDEQLIKEFGITHDSEYYYYSEYKYKKLQEAISYAKLDTQRDK